MLGATLTLFHTPFSGKQGPLWRCLFPRTTPEYFFSFHVVTPLGKQKANLKQFQRKSCRRRDRISLAIGVKVS